MIIYGEWEKLEALDLWYFPTKFANKFIIKNVLTTIQLDISAFMEIQAKLCITHNAM